MRNSRLAWADAVLAVMALALCVYSTVTVYANANSAHVAISSPAGSFIYPLNENRSLTIEGKQGQTLIVIDNGYVQVTDSACRDKLCVLAGKLSKPGQWTACLPNGVYVRVEGDKKDVDIDAVVK